jgi:hypothetical protein
MTKSPTSQLSIRLEDFPNLTTEQWRTLTTPLDFNISNNKDSSFISTQICLLLKEFWDTLLPQMNLSTKSSFYSAQLNSIKLLKWFRYWSGSHNEYVYLYFFIQCYKLDNLPISDSSASKHPLNYTKLWLSCLEGGYTRDPSNGLIDSIINAFRIIKAKSIKEAQVLFPELEDTSSANLLRKLLAHISHQLETRSTTFPNLIIIFKQLTNFLISSAAQSIQPFEQLKSTILFEDLNQASKAPNQGPTLHSITTISILSTNLKPETWYKSNPLFSPFLHEKVPNNHEDPISLTESCFDQWKIMVADYTSLEISNYIEELIFEFYPSKETQNGLTNLSYNLDYMISRWLIYYSDRISVVLNPLIKMIVDGQIKYFHNKSPFLAISDLFNTTQYSELNYNILTYLTMNNNSNRLNGWLAHCMSLSKESTLTKYYEFIVKHMIIAPQINPDDDGTTLNRWIDFTKGLLCEKKLFITNSFFRFLFKLEENDPYMKRRLDICTLLDQQLNLYITAYPVFHLQKLFHLLILDNILISFETFEPLFKYLINHFIENAQLKEGEAIEIFQIIAQTLITLINYPVKSNLPTEVLEYILRHEHLCLPLIFGNAKDEKKHSMAQSEPYISFPTHDISPSKLFIKLSEYISRIGNAKIRTKILSIWLKSWSSSTNAISFDIIVNLAHLFTEDFSILHPWIKSILIHNIRYPSSNQEQESKISTLIQIGLLTCSNPKSTQFSNITSFLIQNEFIGENGLILEVVKNIKSVSEFFLTFSSTAELDENRDKRTSVFKRLITTFKSRLQFANSQIIQLKTTNLAIFEKLMINTEFINSLFLMLQFCQVNKVLFDQFNSISQIILESSKIQCQLKFFDLTNILSTVNILPILQTQRANWEDDQWTKIAKIIENLSKPFTLTNQTLNEPPLTISQFIEQSSTFQLKANSGKHSQTIQNGPITNAIPFYSPFV